VQKIVVKLTSLAKGITQSTLSLSFNLAGLIAGVIVAENLSVIESVSWGLLLYPGILSLRGSIGGMYAGRLSTALHLGTVEARLRNNSGEARLLSDSTAVLSVISSITMALTASMFSILFNAGPFDILGIILVTVATMSTSLVLVSPLTFAVSVFTYKRGLDPDVTVYPIISTAADIVVTTAYILALKAISAPFGWVFLSVLDLVSVAFALSAALRNRESRAFLKNLKEFTLTLVVVSFIVNVTGSLLENLMLKIGHRPEIYVVYPALIDTVGDVGSIVGSTASTKIAQGLLNPSFSNIRMHVNEIFHAWAGSLAMFGAYSFIPSVLFSISHPESLLSQLLLTNIMAVSVIVVVSMGVAFSTAARGWEPDNFIIPIESAMSDGIATAAILLATSLVP